MVNCIVKEAASKSSVSASVSIVLLDTVVKQSQIYIFCLLGERFLI